LSIRVSPISRTAAILIIVVGLFVLAAGLTTGDTANLVAGIAFSALGIALYLLLFWFARRVQREIGEPEKA
jgi:uncharacterized membrane protein HdeD (DUF308 family)